MYDAHTLPCILYVGEHAEQYTHEGADQSGEFLTTAITARSSPPEYK